MDYSTSRRSRRHPSSPQRKLWVKAQKNKKARKRGRHKCQNQEVTSLLRGNSPRLFFELVSFDSLILAAKLSYPRFGNVHCKRNRGRGPECLIRITYEFVNPSAV